MKPASSSPNAAEELQFLDKLWALPCDTRWSRADSTPLHHSYERRVIEMCTKQVTGRSFSASPRTHIHASQSTQKQSLRAGCCRDCAGMLSAYGWLAVLGILLCALMGPAAAAEPAVKNVLVLHNWANLPQAWALMESTVRARVPGETNFYNTSVENPRFDQAVYRESLAETLRRGYAGVKLDVVVAASYPVLQFAVQYRDKMFPGVPIVFTDVGRPEVQKMWPGVTGVISPIGMRETIDLALHLHPNTRAIAVIAGITKWDKYWLAVAHSELLRHQDKVTEIDILGPAGQQILEKVAELPPHTVVLFQLGPDLTRPALGALASYLTSHSACQPIPPGKDLR